jgi:hypothetical protein
MKKLLKLDKQALVATVAAGALAVALAFLAGPEPEQNGCAW